MNSMEKATLTTATAGTNRLTFFLVMKKIKRSIINNTSLHLLMVNLSLEVLIFNNHQLKIKDFYLLLDPEIAGKEMIPILQSVLVLHQLVYMQEVSLMTFTTDQEETGGSWWTLQLLLEEVVVDWRIG